VLSARYAAFTVASEVKASVVDEEVVEGDVAEPVVTPDEVVLSAELSMLEGSVVVPAVSSLQAAINTVAPTATAASPHALLNDTPPLGGTPSRRGKKSLGPSQIA
jgi:hypothetical protein